MPTLGNAGFGFLLTYGFNDLTGDFLNRHYPKQSFSFSHCSINQAWAKSVTMQPFLLHHAACMSAAHLLEVKNKKPYLT